MPALAGAKDVLAASACVGPESASSAPGGTADSCSLSTSSSGPSGTVASSEDATPPADTNSDADNSEEGAQRSRRNHSDGTGSWSALLQQLTSRRRNVAGERGSGATAAAGSRVSESDDEYNVLIKPARVHKVGGSGKLPGHSAASRDASGTLTGARAGRDASDTAQESASPSASQGAAEAKPAAADDPVQAAEIPAEVAGAPAEAAAAPTPPSTVSWDERPCAAATAYRLPDESECMPIGTNDQNKNAPSGGSAAASAGNSAAAAVAVGAAQAVVQPMPRARANSRATQARRAQPAQNSPRMPPPSPRAAKKQAAVGTQAERANTASGPNSNPVNTPAAAARKQPACAAQPAALDPTAEASSGRVAQAARPAAKRGDGGARALSAAPAGSPRSAVPSPRGRVPQANATPAGKRSQSAAVRSPRNISARPQQPANEHPHSALHPSKSAAAVSAAPQTAGCLASQRAAVDWQKLHTARRARTLAWLQEQKGALDALGRQFAVLPERRTRLLAPPQESSRSVTSSIDGFLDAEKLALAAANSGMPLSTAQPAANHMRSRLHLLSPRNGKQARSAAQPQAQAQLQSPRGAVPMPGGLPGPPITPRTAKGLQAGGMRAGGSAIPFGMTSHATARQQAGIAKASAYLAQPLAAPNPVAKGQLQQSKVPGSAAKAPVVDALRAPAITPRPAMMACQRRQNA